MLLHLPPGADALARVFSLIEQRGAQRIAYFNNSSAAELLSAVRSGKWRWTSDPQRMRNFEYERVQSVFELLAKLDIPYDLVVVEHLDVLVQEPTRELYAEVNRALAGIMARVTCGVFIDSWAYLDKYYLWDEPDLLGL